MCVCWLHIQDWDALNDLYKCDPRNSKFGIGINYILKISKENSNEVFEIFSTNLLAEYIYTVKLDKLFKFTVHERNNTKYPVIDGFKKERKFTMLN